MVDKTVCMLNLTGEFRRPLVFLSKHIKYNYVDLTPPRINNRWPGSLEGNSEGVKKIRVDRNATNSQMTESMQGV